MYAPVAGKKLWQGQVLFPLNVPIVKKLKFSVVRYAENLAMNINVRTVDLKVLEVKKCLFW